MKTLIGKGAKKRGGWALWCRAINCPEDWYWLGSWILPDTERRAATYPDIYETLILPHGETPLQGLLGEDK